MAKAAEHNDAWQTTNFRIAVNASVIESANRSQDEWANPEDRFSNAQLRQNPSRTRLLWDDEVQRLASIRLHDMAPSPPAFRGTRSSAPIDVGEDGTCDKCGGSHATEACPHYRRGGTPYKRVAGIYVGTLDQAYTHLIRDLHRCLRHTDRNGPTRVSGQLKIRASWQRAGQGSLSRIQERQAHRAITGSPSSTAFASVPFRAHLMLEQLAPPVDLRCPLEAAHQRLDVRPLPCRSVRERR